MDARWACVHNNPGRLGNGQQLHVKPYERTQLNLLGLGSWLEQTRLLAGAGGGGGATSFLPAPSLRSWLYTAMFSSCNLCLGPAMNVHN